MFVTKINYIRRHQLKLFDGQQRISKVDLSTGQIVSQLNRRGRGPEEYNYVMGIAGDDEHIYLLDNNSGRTIHAYDYDFKHQYKFSIDWSTLPSTFISLGDGFLFQNGSENDSIGKFVFTDNQGRITKSFLELQEKEPEPDGDIVMLVVVHTEELFIPLSKGNILCYNPDTYEAYLYDGKDMTQGNDPTVSFFATPAASFATIIHLRTRAHAQESTFAALLLK